MTTQVFLIECSYKSAFPLEPTSEIRIFSNMLKVITFNSCFFSQIHQVYNLPTNQYSILFRLRHKEYLLPSFSDSMPKVIKNEDNSSVRSLSKSRGQDINFRTVFENKISSGL